VVDVRSSAVEDVREIREFADRVSARVANEVSIVPNGDLQFVPERIARRKLAVLGEARSPLKEAA
jgi:5-methyltetrahydropteroyltriglutamate--homocysteine methyltransferase